MTIKAEMIFQETPIKHIAIAFALLFTITSALPGMLIASSSVQPLALSANFVYLPKFIVMGDNVNFKSSISGGNAPYTVLSSFGDGTSRTGAQIYHRFTLAGTYDVNMTVLDSSSPTPQKNSIVQSVAVQVWPVRRDGWLIRWNITQNDGINIWNVTYHGVLTIVDARIAGVEVIYRQNLCGPFYDEPFNETGVKEDGNIFYENSTSTLNPYFQLRAEYRVEGYYYQETFRFYPSGRWDM